MSGAAALSAPISVVVPVKDEAGNVGPLAREIAAALAGESHEILFIDDGSSDGTDATLSVLKADTPKLLAVLWAEPNRRDGFGVCGRNARTVQKRSGILSGCHAGGLLFAARKFRLQEGPCLRIPVGTTANPDEERQIKQLWPDQEAYRREEQRRFEILLAHWDLPVTDITPAKK